MIEDGLKSILISWRKDLEKNKRIHTNAFIPLSKIDPSPFPSPLEWEKEGVRGAEPNAKINSAVELA